MIQVPSSISIPNISTSSVSCDVLNMIRICGHNARGLTKDKLHRGLLGSLYSNHHLSFVFETWAEKDSVTATASLKGFTYIDFARDSRHPDARRGSGGIGLFISKNISKGVEIVKANKDISVSVKLKKEFFGLDRDIIITGIYFPPEGSNYSIHDVYHMLQEIFSDLPMTAEHLCIGDINGHVRLGLDYIIDDICGSDGELSGLIPDDSNIRNTRQCIISTLLAQDKLKRFSKDRRSIDFFGQGLLDFCKISQMLLLNGRKGDDRINGGCSTVDYAFCTPKLFNDIANFSIGPYYPESDHLPLIVELPITVQGANQISSNEPDVDWVGHMKYQWTNEKLNDFCVNLQDELSCKYREDYLNAIESDQPSELVAQSFGKFIAQALDRSDIHKRKVITRTSCDNPDWFDSELKQLRQNAIKAGERVNSQSDRDFLNVQCKKYKSCKQRKKREYRTKNLAELEKAYSENNGNVWDILNKHNRDNSADKMPPKSEFYSYFLNLSKGKEAVYFDANYEHKVKSFLDKYDENPDDILQEFGEDLENLNSDFTVEEIGNVIDKLKSKRAAGIDGIPSEFLKHCKDLLLADLTRILNYILARKDFPESWAEGLRTPVYKSGDYSDTGNYRGITVLSVYAKIFETAVNDRLIDFSEMFLKTDLCNGGFLKDSRTSDNVFILRGLIEKQLSLGKRLFVCFVDFSKAFDLINRYILFYKLIKMGYGGRLLDTVRNLYSKTFFHVKMNGLLSPPILDVFGVNQGGNASPTLFRKYLCDLGDYLESRYGIVIGDTILAHLLWADDLVLMSDTREGLQKQLDGLYKFCADNHMIVNELKTKVMVFGGNTKPDIVFNGKLIKIVDKYKYLGIIISSISKINGDIFKLNYDFLIDKARRAMFAMFNRLKPFHDPPVSLKLKLFDSLVRPILMYGSDIWGTSKAGKNKIDTFFLRFLKSTLGVKKSTSTLMVYGETGKIPLSHIANGNVLAYRYRVGGFTAEKIVKKIFDELKRLDDLGFHTWFSHVKCIERIYPSGMGVSTADTLKHHIKVNVNNSYEASWSDGINNVKANPGLRVYRKINQSLNFQSYLDNVRDFRFRKAFAQIRCSSHSLEIERGRHRPIPIPAHLRLCKQCGTVDDEVHFLTQCTIFSHERSFLFRSIDPKCPNFSCLDNESKLVYLLTTEDSQIQNWVGKFCYYAFRKKGGAAQ